MKFTAWYFLILGIVGFHIAVFKNAFIGREGVELMAMFSATDVLISIAISCIARMPSIPAGAAGQPDTR